MYLSVTVVVGVQSVPGNTHTHTLSLSLSLSLPLSLCLSYIRARTHTYTHPAAQKLYGEGEGAIVNRCVGYLLGIFFCFLS